MSTATSAVVSRAKQKSAKIASFQFKDADETEIIYYSTNQVTYVQIRIHGKVDCGLHLLVVMVLYTKEIGKSGSEIPKIMYNNSIPLELTTANSLTISSLPTSKSGIPDSFFPYCNCCKYSRE